MTPTDELRQELRELLDEVIPTGGTEGDTRFTSTQIDRLLTRADNVYLAAAIGWRLKAGMLQRELGRIEESQAGDERQKRVNLTTALNYCTSMAGMYQGMGEKESPSAGSRIMSFEPPDVLGTGVVE